MKRILFQIALTLCLCGGVSRAADRPNFIMVLIDDMGWGDFSCFGNPDAQTPNVDRLAAEGIRFSQFYVNSPICSASRCALTTGQYP
ncbi:MAG: sulfatase-like hydrolase/transferase, partial [Verrucomicrobiales bacterium]|nr:sulfatase-like hydrolase/transferase [Verrucomicrobiales bacterium]